MFKTKKFKAFVGMAIVAVFVIAASPTTLRRNVWNALQYFKQGLYVGTTNQTKIYSDGSASLADGGIVYNTSGQHTTAAGETPTRSIQFDLSDFKRIWTGSEVGVGTNEYEVLGGVIGTGKSNYPYLQISALSPAIVWPFYHPLDRGNGGDAGAGGVLNDFNRGSSYHLPGEVYKSVVEQYSAPLSPIQVTFRVPEDYRASGTIKMLLHQYGSLESTANTTARAVRLGYRIFNTALSESSEGGYWDSTAIITLPIQVGTVGHHLSPLEIEFAITAGETTLAAGQYIAFQYWRIRDLSVVDDLRHLAARFQYSSEY